MKDKKLDARRKLLGSAIAAGAVVSAPSQWVKPSIGSVILPAHAQTTDSGTTEQEETPPQVFFGNISDDVLTSTGSEGQNPLMDILGQPAYAQEIEPAAYLCITTMGDQYDAILTVVSEIGRDNLEISGGSFGVKENLNGGGDGCASSVGSGTLVVSPPSGGTIGYSLTDAGAGTINEGSCMEFSEVCFVSDVNLKGNFNEVDQQDILQKVVDMPVEYWNYTADGQSIRHIGPMAQDFRNAFGLGDSEKRIHMVDANGINVAAIQALHQKIEEKDARIEKLEHQVQLLMEKLNH
ncbi:MAG: tail fiber domain-containing protein [Pseudomonadota bacterium]